MNPMWDAKKPVVPFDRDGNMLHYPDHWLMKDGGEWREVQPFEAVLSFDTYGRGRSAAYFIVTDVTTETEYPVFISDLLDILQTRDVIAGAVTGRWAVRKKGQNYGIGPAK